MCICGASCGPRVDPAPPVVEEEREPGGPSAPSLNQLIPRFLASAKMYFFPRQKCITYQEIIFLNLSGGENGEKAHSYIYAFMQTSAKHIFFNKNIFLQARHFSVPKIVFKI